VAQRFTAAITGLFSAPALQIAEKLGFVSGHRFSDAENPPKSVRPFRGRASEVYFFNNLFSRCGDTPAS
jgi:hypothetical protein